MSISLMLIAILRFSARAKQLLRARFRWFCSTRGRGTGVQTYHLYLVLTWVVFLFVPTYHLFLFDFRILPVYIIDVFMRRRKYLVHGNPVPYN